MAPPGPPVPTPMLVGMGKGDTCETYKQRAGASWRCTTRSTTLATVGTMEMGR